MMSKMKSMAKDSFLPIRSSFGFTLTEVLVVIGMIAILTPALYVTFNRLLRSYTTENAVGGIQQTARYAIEYMVRDIRMAGFDPLGEAEAGIEEAINIPDPADPTTIRQWIRFTTDLDGDGDIAEDSFEQITYRYDPGNLELVQVLDEGSATPSSGTLVENVTNLSFRFFDDDNNEVIPATPTDATVDDIRVVQIDLTVEEPAGIVGQRDRSYRSQVRIRNADL